MTLLVWLRSLGLARFYRRFIVVAICVFVVVWLVVMFSCLPDASSDLKNVRGQKVKKFLVVVILSSPTSYKAREAIRRTWFNLVALEQLSIVRLFAIGERDLPVEVREKVLEENYGFRDLLLLPDLVDSYANLTNKVVQSFQWINAQLDFDFVLKLDDDSFARLDLIYKELRDIKSERYYWGFFSGNARVKRVGKWAEKKWIMCDRYLPYARGGGYALSSDLVQYIADNAKLLQTFLSEDVSVGAWLGPLDIQRVHDERFDTEYISRGCNNSYLVTHKQDPDALFNKYKQLQIDGKLCKEEFRTKASYAYNWNVQPSDCCVRNNVSV